MAERMRALTGSDHTWGSSLPFTFHWVKANHLAKSVLMGQENRVVLQGEEINN